MCRRTASRNSEGFSLTFGGSSVDQIRSEEADCWAGVDAVRVTHSESSSE
jgi:hypothetical protein